MATPKKKPEPIEKLKEPTPQFITRKDILEAADKCVNGGRDQDYGTPENNFGFIAALWTIYLDHLITDMDVANMMTLLKVARTKSGRPTKDSFIDMAGYAACGGELCKFEKG